MNTVSASFAQRNNVSILGSGTRKMVFAHGFGCDQSMWRFITPAFHDDFCIVLYDHVGAGQSDLSQFDPVKYASLQGYADDLIEICKATGPGKAVFVGHSVSSMIGVLAAVKAPDLFEDLTLVAPFPCYINDGDYVGGFNRADIDELLDFMDMNYLGWSSALAGTIMGNPERPDLTTELENSFCRTDPDIARHFAKTTFLSDNRADLPKLKTPSLILQCAEDVIAPLQIGAYMHRNMAGSRLHNMRATGHCPNLSAPNETVQAIQTYLGSETGRPANTAAAR